MPTRHLNGMGVRTPKFVLQSRQMLCHHAISGLWYEINCCKLHKSTSLMVIHANKHSRREITPAIPKKTVSMKLGIVLFIFAKVIKKRIQNIVFFIF